MPNVKSDVELRKVAFLRLQELLTDMGWIEEVAVRQLILEVAPGLGVKRKAVEQWFERGELPAHVAFAIAEAFGIQAGWMAGQTGIEKADAILESGLYDREVNRARLRPTA